MSKQTDTNGRERARGACSTAPCARVAVRPAAAVAAYAVLCLLVALALSGCADVATSLRTSMGFQSSREPIAHAQQLEGFHPSDLPSYDSRASVEVNGNVPFFAEQDLTTAPLADFSALDRRGRCGTACMLVGPETMPDVQRGSIGGVRPSGWRIARYDWIDGTYLFNRCHLIAFALSGENDNPLNLITGTRSMNISGMLPYEERVARYIDRTGNHVLYRVTPYFEGDELVARGVLMEAASIEDDGRGIRYCVWCYNVEPSVVIDYATGDNREGDPASETFDVPSGDGQAGADGGEVPGDGGEAEEGGMPTKLAGIPRAEAPETDESGADPEASSAGGEAVADQDAAGSQDQEQQVLTYVLNTNTYRFHYPDCSSVADMKEKNKQVFEGTRQEAIDMGYVPCGNCRP